MKNVYPRSLVPLTLLCLGLFGLTPVRSIHAQAIPRAYVANMSTRCFVGTGDRVAIAGFIISGSSPKQVVVRGIGPSVAAYFSEPVISNPLLQLKNSSGGTIATNDNWRTTQQQALISSGIAPGNDLESAIIITLNPGNYSAILSDAGGATGLGMVELYDLSGNLANGFTYSDGTEITAPVWSGHNHLFKASSAITPKSSGQLKVFVTAKSVAQTYGYGRAYIDIKLIDQATGFQLNIDRWYPSNLGNVFVSTVKNFNVQANVPVRIELLGGTNSPNTDFDFIITNQFDINAPVTYP